MVSGTAWMKSSPSRFTPTTVTLNFLRHSLVTSGNADDRVRRGQPGDREFVAESDEVEQAFVEQMRDPLAHALFGKDDMVRAGAFEDAGVLLVGRLGPDVGQAEIGQRQHRQHAGLYIGADGDHCGLEIGDAQLLQRRHLGAVGLDHLGQLAREFLHHGAGRCRRPAPRAPCVRA